MKCLGIDWGHRELCIAVLDEDARFTVQERWSAYDVGGLLARVRELGGAAEHTVCIEGGAGLLRDTFRAHGYTVLEIAPAVASRMAKLHHPSGAKDDARDARTLALAVLHGQLGLTIDRVVSARAQELKDCTAVRQRLVAQRTRTMQQVISVLRRSHPGLAALELDLRTRYARRLIAAYPDPLSASRAQRAKIERILQEGRCRKLAAEEVLSKLRDHGHVIARHVARTCALELPLLIKQLDLHWQQIATTDARIQALIADHPDREILTSVPGMGVQLCARIAGRVDGDTVQEMSARQVQILSGTAPRTRVSGKRSGGSVQRRAARDRHFHQALFQLARCSLRSSAWAKRFYTAHTAGKPRTMRTRNKATRALANKWVKIIHHLLLTRTLYDEARHCDNLRRHHVPWAPAPAENAA